MAFIDWIENSLLGTCMVDSVWAYPIALSTHAIGMSIVVGTIVIIDLRILGLAESIPLKSFEKLFVVTSFGVVLNFLSGLALFATEPARFFYHPVFWIKIALIVAGALSVYILWHKVKCVNDDADSSARIKLVAVFSLLLWACVIVAGRLIAYIEMG
jgi:uncharacterized protein DUF6644